MRLAIDVGYGFTKALGENGRKAVFPSFITLARADTAGGLFQSLPHEASINQEKWFVGERARQCVSCLSLPGQARKNGKVHDILLLTAAYLAGAGEEGRDEVAVGLPLAYYRAQKDSLRDSVAQLAAWVGVDGGRERHVSFEKVHVFPQGAGVLALCDDLPARGYVLIIDVGTYTTEYLLFEARNGRYIPIPDACSSAELGVHAVHLALGAAWQEKTGVPLPPRMAEEVMEAARLGEPVLQDGRKIDLSAAYRRAVEQVSEAIVAAIKGTLQDRAGFVGKTLLAGGGAEVFGSCFRTAFPLVETVRDPVMANCQGYLRLMG